MLCGKPFPRFFNMPTNILARSRETTDHTSLPAPVDVLFNRAGCCFLPSARAHRFANDTMSVCTQSRMHERFQISFLMNQYVSSNASTIDGSYGVHMMTDLHEVAFAARSDQSDGEALLRRRRAPSPEHVSPVHGRGDSEYQVTSRNVERRITSYPPGLFGLCRVPFSCKQRLQPQQGATFCAYGSG